MYKKIVLSVFLSLFLVTKPVSMPSVLKASPENTVVVIELHNVFMSYTGFNFFYALSKFMLSADNKIELIKLYFDKAFWRDVNRLSKELKVGESMVPELCKLYPQLAAYEGDIQMLSVIDRWKPNLEIIDLIKKIKQKGYAVYGIENIGPMALKIVSNAYKDEFALFDGFYIPTDAHDKTLNLPEFYTNLRQEKLNTEGHEGKQALAFVGKNDMFLAVLKTTNANIVAVKINSVTQFKKELEQRGLLG